jgi:tetratricopeptide (TPR) repeat protein
MLTPVTFQVYQRPANVAARLMQSIAWGIARLIGEVLVWRISQMMARSEYTKAVDLGKRKHKFVAHSSHLSQARHLLNAEFDLHYGLALIYIGHVAEGMTLLKGIVTGLEALQKPRHVAWLADPHGLDLRRNYILGRAHNNLGYGYWTRIRDYESALEEFRAALLYFSASKIWEEFANTCDNMARVYTELGDRNRARKLLDKAIELRRNLGPKYQYRLALSLNSKAIYHLTFGELTQATNLARESLTMYQQLGKRRGIGLASITLGRAQRHIAGRRPDLSVHERIDLLREAEKHLLNARTIFERSVQEPIRLVEIDTELRHLRHEWDVAPVDELVVTCPLLNR